MKYILSGLTFIIGFILFVLFHVATKREIGGFVSILLFSLIVGATTLVYKKLGGNKDARKIDPSKTTEHSLSKLEMKDFNKVFTADVCQKLNIKLLRITHSKYDRTDYIVSIASGDFSKVDLDGVKKLLKKRFYDVSRILLEESQEGDSVPSYTIKH